MAQHNIPAEVYVEALSEGARYVFPRRDLGRLRYLCALLVVPGLVFVYFMLSAPLSAVMGPPGPGRPMAYAALALWTVVTLLPILAVMRFAILVAWSHCEIEATAEEIRIQERAGWLRRAKAIRWDDVSKLRVIDTATGGDAAGRWSRAIAGLDSLEAKTADGQRAIIAPGYPITWLLPVAEDLVRIRSQKQRNSAATEPSVVPIETIVAKSMQDLVGDERKAPAPDDVYEQPAKSVIQLQNYAEGPTFIVPPSGLGKGDAGMFTFGVIWCGGMVLFTAVFLYSGPQGNALWGVLGILSLFWLAGIALLTAGWNMGRRQAAVALVRDRLMVMQTGLFRTKNLEWPRSDIRTVDVGPSGYEVNDKPVLELQIQGTDKKLFGMLAGRDPQELAWMATHLRHALAGDAPISAAPGDRRATEEEQEQEQEQEEEEEEEN